MVANHPSFLPRLVPHLFHHQRSRPQTPSRRSTRSMPESISSTFTGNDHRSPTQSLSPMSVSSDRVELEVLNHSQPDFSLPHSPMSTTANPAGTCLHLPHSSMSDPPMSTASVPTFQFRIQESPQSGLPDSSSSSNSDHTSTPLHLSRLDTVILLNAVVDGGVHDAAAIFLSYYAYWPQDVLSAIAILASGNQNDHRNLTRLLRSLIEANPSTATAILHHFLSLSGR